MCLSFAVYWCDVIGCLSVISVIYIYLFLVLSRNEGPNLTLSEVLCLQVLVSLHLSQHALSIPSQAVHSVLLLPVLLSPPQEVSRAENHLSCCWTLRCLRFTLARRTVRLLRERQSSPLDVEDQVRGVAGASSLMPTLVLYDIRAPIIDPLCAWKPLILMP